MAVTLSTGPTVSAGPLLGGPGAPDPNYLAGPGYAYQGDCIADVRFPLPAGAERLGMAKSFSDTPFVMLANKLAAASAAAPVNIAAAANVVSGTAMTLAGYSAGITPGVTIPLLSTSALVQVGLSLDVGFSSVATTAGSAVVTPAAADMFLFQVGSVYGPGTWVMIGGVGNAGGTLPLFAQIAAVGTTTLTLSTPALATQSAAPICGTNQRDPLVPAPATAYEPYAQAGYVARFSAREGVGRGVGIAGSASATGGAFKVVGYDIYGAAMSETITHPGSTAVQYGKKAFKHIASVTPQFTDAHNYSVGTSDVFGFHVRNDLWEGMNIFVGGAFLSTNTGYTAADTTSPSTSTTGDVRGTIQIGTRGPLGSGASGGPISGSVRVTIYQSLDPDLLTACSPSYTAPMFGVAQA